jgi:nucleoredoxin
MEGNRVLSIVCVLSIFSAHWCPPCRSFTPVLAKIYNDMEPALKEKFEIVFVSSDENDDTFNEYFQTMPWKAVQFSGETLFTLVRKQRMKGAR